MLSKVSQKDRQPLGDHTHLQNIKKQSKGLAKFQWNSLKIGFTELQAEVDGRGFRQRILG